MNKTNEMIKAIILCIIILVVVFFVFIPEKSPVSDAALKSNADLQLEIRMLKDQQNTMRNQIETLQGQVDNLNETVYQNRQYIMALEEIYNYLAKEITEEDIGNE